ncbi:EGF-like domain-containing protein [Tieghemostelium lacteum]|uniref:EGF-like domain-containing protein n=1 Tax=Tieghemostelium lacteum TaxID=361077 RepID=A0A151ZI28_TIELA|nr:EGF-like domain-containing protein [Tieghemostelium lacteum]|eukprot:KYQ93642.1 EGF-like domain-containing protein [Tieghemostelium lacteum]
MKYKIYSIFYFILLFCVCNSAVPQNQINALAALSTQLAYSWNVAPATICQQQYFKCDATESYIISLILLPIATPTPMPADIYSLIDLRILSIGSYIQLSTLFWFNFGVFTNLETFYFSFPTQDLPGNIGSLIPQSVQHLTIDKSDYLMPEDLFTLTNFSSVNIANLNSYDVAVFPSSINQPSTITSFVTTSFGLFDMVGTNFVKIDYLELTFNGAANPMNYDKFNTWTPKQLYLQYNPVVPQSFFPTSVSLMTTLTTLTIRSNNRLIIDPTKDVIDFSNIDLLMALQIYNWDTLPDLTFPGFKMSTNLNRQTNAIIYDSVVDPSVLDIFAFKEFSLESPTLVGEIPEGAYSKMSTFSISNSPSFAGTIPDSLCQIKEYFSIVNTSITSLPSCILCEWGNPSIEYLFRNNPNLSTLTRSCTNFQISNYTKLIPTMGGVVDIYGLDLGWNIYNVNGDPLFSTVFIGNQVLSFYGPTGVGKNVNYTVKFHYEADPDTPGHLLTFDFFPPSIDTYTVDRGALKLTGTNFYETGTELFIAGQNTSIFHSFYNTIDSVENVIPYTADLTFSVRVVVGGQEDYKIFRAAGFSPELDQPFPMLYSGGGYVEFTGSYLTFDTTIMNLTINGILFSNISEASSTRFLIKYSPIAAGNYTLDFIYLDYQLYSMIEVSNTPPCKIVLTNGFCRGSQPVCFKPFTGPDCGSEPSYLERATLNTTNPDIISKVYQTTWKSETSRFSFAISTTSIKEIDPVGTTVNTYSPLTFPAYQYTNQTVYDQFSYTSNDFSGTNTKFLDYLMWSYNYFTVTNNNGNPTEQEPSTYKYQVGLTQHNFTSPNNQLEIKHQFEINFLSTKMDICSRVETDTLLTIADYDYLKLKINYLDLYTKIYKLTTAGLSVFPLNYTTTTISQTPQKIVQELTIYAKSWTDAYFVYDFDVTVLYDSVKAQYEESPTCVFTPSPTPTKPSDKPCPGDPICGGTSQGQCVNSHCQCISPWRGVQCDSKPDIIPPVIPDPETPTINSTKDEIGFHISIISLRELNFNGVLEREQYLSNWTVIETKTEQKQTFYYKNKVFGNSSTNNDTIVFVTIDYFYVDTQVEFAGETSTKSAGTIKYSANVTSWPFLKKTNQLQIVFSSSAQDNTESSDSCTLKNVEYSQDQQDNVEVVYIQVNDKTFQSKFIDDAIVDGTIRQIKNVELPNVVNDSNTLSSSLIGILTPYHNEYVLIDPDFSLLISYVPPKDKEGSICSEKSKKKLSNAQIAGIVVGGFVFLVAVVAITVYAIKFNMKKRALVLSFNQKFQAVNNQK